MLLEQNLEFIYLQIEAEEEKEKNFFPFFSEIGWQYNST